MMAEWLWMREMLGGGVGETTISTVPDYLGNCYTYTGLTLTCADVVGFPNPTILSIP